MARESVNGMTETTSSKARKEARKHGSRKKFSEEEDREIIRRVEEHGTVSWSVVASGLPGRSPRQVRERWLNYLSPDVSSKPWTHAEDMKLKEKVDDLGNKWSIIALDFPGRTDVTIKNRYRLLERHNFVLPEKLMPPAESDEIDEFESAFQPEDDQGDDGENEMDWELLTSMEAFGVM